MPKNFFSLVNHKGFGSLFWIQCLSAFQDNLFRSALLIIATYGMGIYQGQDAAILTPFIGGIVILPFFLFSSLAGQFADKYNKATLVKIIKGCEIAVVLFAIYGFHQKSLPLMLLTLFLNMIQSTFFGPLKYSLIPSYLSPEKVIHGNALIESSTFLSILLGSILGGVLIRIEGLGGIFLNLVMLASVISSWMISLKLPDIQGGDRTLKINWNLYKETLSIIRYASKDRVVFLAIIGISWFWVIGSVMLTQIGAYGKDVIGANESVALLFMFLFAIGIGIGSYLCNRWMHGEIDARVVPWGAIGTTIFIIDLVYTSHYVGFSTPDYMGIKQFLKTASGWRICVDLLFIAVGSGISMVPLYALVQTQSDPRHCSRVIAANNVINAFFMVISSVATMLLIALNVTILNIFLIVGVLNLFVIHRLSVLVPESILQLILQAIFKLFFRVEVKGLDNFYKAGDRVLIISNHISFLDAALLFAFIPEKLSYAIYTFYIDKWWIRMIKPGINLLPVDPTNPMATKKLIELIRQGKKCVIFPEGRITETGSLMKVFDGPGMIADRSEANIVPIRIEGAQFSYFSRLKGKLRRQAFPKISVTILPPEKVRAPEELKGRERRRVITNHLYDIMVGMMFDTSAYQETTITSLLEVAKQHGMNRVIIEDIQRQPLTYRKLIMRCFILGNWLKTKTTQSEYVGVMLPTSVASALCFFGLLLVGRVPAMLNFSLGAQTLLQTGKLARVRLILTSRKFVELARLETTIAELEKTFTVFYLEDLKSVIGLKAKLKGLLSSYFPELASRKLQRQISVKDPAVILFTSGSEGMPKGVALSHENLNANRYQITTSIDLNSQDVVLNVLPTFHSFGLTGGLLAPILSGIKVFMYPSPLHYRTIPVTSYDINATIFFATDTFLSRYAVSAHPYDFYSMRYVVAGAEKLRPETRRQWMEKFGIYVHEGYGTTEASPAVAINTRMQNKVGTVGRFMPGMDYFIHPIEGVANGGRLLIKGPNVMLGYLLPETGKINPTAAVLQVGEAPMPGWYDTGDIVNVDSQGFVTILGRAKRFAKIAGEMVSLAAVEELMQHAYPEHHHVVLSEPDPRRGEQLILLTTAAIKRDNVVDCFKAQGAAEIVIPRRVFTVGAIPLLPTGKVNFLGAKELLIELLMAEEKYDV
ncbi:acyl-[ACP]--phospholipid O-acyltransferase [Candidatus Paracaedibacter symbiosus]|uniref:acyl-[ACP]--phospholipid O-acyltransferase n=1 Tax=Candidatus Paracaedibacter symbiosus TaxID=244582 RepID=UPI000509768F|nr:acyl-[ACP]--phospholipid O-acyltransferase [Candidatus Paracaedibacter symbiosus]